MRTAVLFPGQGSQTTDMRSIVEAHRPDLVDLVIEATGDDPFARIDDGTRFVQPALFAAGLAAWAGLADRVGPVHAFAGHSLGELTALTAAGVLSEPDAIELVVLRGRLMEEAAKAAGDGGMLAIVGDDARPRGARLAGQYGLVVANDNSPRQVVLSGPLPAIFDAEADAVSRGMRAVRLEVSGAFHSSAVARAVAPFAAALADVTLGRPTAPVFSGVTAAPIEDARWCLAEGLVRPVRWHDTMRALAVAGVERFVEAGPGKVLRKLARATVPEAETAGLDSLVAAHA